MSMLVIHMEWKAIDFYIFFPLLRRFTWFILPLLSSANFISYFYETANQLRKQGVREKIIKTREAFRSIVDQRPFFFSEIGKFHICYAVIV